MRHDWIFDVLTDLVSYAEANGLTETARAVGEALEAAGREICPDDDGGPGSDLLGARPKRRSH